MTVTPSIEAIFPLTPVQQGMLFHALGGDGDAPYINQLIIEFTGQLQTEAFRRAWDLTVRRHGALRTIFAWKHGKEPVQITRRDSPLDWRIEGPLDLDAFLDRDRRDGFHLDKAPPLRITLIAQSARHHILVATHHHLIAEGWSWSIVLGEVFAAYQALLQGVSPDATAPQPSFRDYVAWLGRQDKTQAELWWRGELADVTEPTALPMAGPAKAREPARRADTTRLLSAALSDAVAATARRLGVPHAALLQVAWGMVLASHGGTEHVVFGTPFSGRTVPFAGADGIVGLFINTLPVRIDFPADATLGAVLRAFVAKQSLRERHCHVAPTDLQAWSGVAPGRPLFETLLVMEAFPAGKGMSGTDLSVTAVRSVESTHYPLALTLRSGQGLPTELHLVWDANRWADDAPRVLLDRFAHVLAEIVAAPERTVASISPADTSEMARIASWNATDRPYDTGAALHDLIHTQATKTPDAVAVRFGSKTLTYAQLEQEAERIAAMLAHHGVTKGTLVGVCVNRSHTMVAALLGVLKAGGAYVPLDPDFPPARLAIIVEDSRLALVLTERGLEDRVSGAARLVLIDDAAPQEPWQAPRTQGGNTAYVLFTSGSTGRPKGVEVTHRNLVNFLRAMAQTPGISQQDRLLAVTTLSFDIAALELWLPLITGAQVIVASRRDATDGEALTRLIAQSQASIMQATPATWRMLMAAGWRGSPDLSVLSGGEALPSPLARDLAQGCRAVWNMYGPTETTVWSSVRRVTAKGADSGVEPIGGPIANTRFHILDRHGTALPIGIAGELAIGGDGVARGYLNRPDLTDERFIDHRGDRLYRTGDLARWRADGGLDFLGRMDSQVKLRGYRIELGEIEAALAAHPGLSAAAAAVVADRIVAYTVAVTDPPSTPELRAFLAERLPDYMIPSAFVALSALPLTPNGKIDRKRLPAPPDDQTVQASSRDGLLDLAAALFADMLGVGSYGPDDNFFEQGGHSILAIQLTARLREAFGTDLGLRDLLETPTPAGACARIAQLGGHGRRTAHAGPPRIDDSQAPLSFSQERLWFLDRLEGARAAYLIPLSVRISGPLDADALRAALHTVVVRHDGLGTRFVETPAGIYQETLDDVPVALPVIEAQADHAEDLATQELATPIDLAHAPYFRFRLVRFGACDHLLLGAVHHAVFDGWSAGVMLREVAAAYENPSAAPPAPALRYIDYAAWQRRQDFEPHIAWWTLQLAGAPPLLDIPTDYPRPAVQTYHGAAHRFTLDGAVATALDRLGRQAGATPFMTMLALFQTLLWRHTGQNDIVVGTPVHNRLRPEFEQMIGCFVNTLALRTDFTDDPGFRPLLARVRATCLGAYSHQEVPFEHLVEALAPARDLSHSPVFQVMFAMEAAPFAEAKAGPLTLTPQLGQPRTAKFDLSLFIARTDAGTEATFEYNTDLFTPATIRALAQQFERLARAVAADPKRRLSELPLLAERDVEQVVTDFNRTALPYCAQTLPDLLDRQRARTPGALAVIDGTTRLTYEQLHAKVDAIAHHLTALGARPDRLVGVMLKRSVDLLAAILGVIKSGAAYVPIDPAYPPERIALIVKDASMPLLIIEDGLNRRLAPHGARLVLLTDIPTGSGPTPTPTLIGANLAYVLYTSGSTGTPKGVAITQRSASAFLAWALSAFNRDQLSRVMFATSVCFDLSVFEMFAPLCAGGAVVVAENALFLPALPARDEISLINTVPSAIAALARGGHIPATLKTVNLAGEALGLALVRELYATGTVREVYNLYGPTEDTTYSTYTMVPQDAQRVTVGKPIANGRAYILDKHLQPVPVGVVGEVCLAGDGLARGYHGRPAQTAERFVPDPFSLEPGGRLYRTGDRARWLPDGSIDYLGRMDFMVKLNGFRIETGEVEAALHALPTVDDAVVMVRADTSGTQRLVAYVTGADPDPLVLRSGLKRRLPDYMIPSAILVLDRLPLTPNGKTDRAALPPPPEPVQTAHIHALPSGTGAEARIAAAWADVLAPGAAFGPDDNFFDVGGHSLLVLRVHTMLRDAFPDLTVVDLFRLPTVRSLAGHLEAKPQAVAQHTDRSHHQRQAARSMMRRAHAQG